MFRVRLNNSAIVGEIHFRDLQMYTYRHALHVMQDIYNVKIIEDFIKICCNLILFYRNR